MLVVRGLIVYKPKILGSYSVFKRKGKNQKSNLNLKNLIFLHLNANMSTDTYIVNLITTIGIY